MKLQHVERLGVFYEQAPDQRLKVGRLVAHARRILFEFDQDLLNTRLEISPFHLRNMPGVVEGDPTLFNGLIGVFDDSLPDGWGRLLVDRRALELGMSGAELTPLDRLAIVGARSMGALVYEPEIAIEDPVVVQLAELAEQAAAVQRDVGAVDLDRLIAVGGSPKGARPKALIQIGDDEVIRVGAKDIQPGSSAWLVKFPAPHDDPHIAPLEHAYFLMAKAAGLDVPRTRILGKTSKNSPGYFAIERFDRDGARRIHSHTLGGLLHLAHGYPAFDYRDLIEVTRKLTRDEEAVAEMFRRACFNVLAHNRDDHVRNFSFLMNGAGEWRPSPAYDLTFEIGPGGEHTMMVLGEGKAPGSSHLLMLAEVTRVKHAPEILAEVDRAVRRFSKFADDAEVPAKLRTQVASRLGVAKQAALPSRAKAAKAVKRVVKKPLARKR